MTENTKKEFWANSQLVSEKIERLWKKIRGLQKKMDVAVANGAPYTSEDLLKLSEEIDLLGRKAFELERTIM